MERSYLLVYAIVVACFWVPKHTCLSVAGKIDMSIALYNWLESTIDEFIGIYEHFDGRMNTSALVTNVISKKMIQSLNKVDFRVDCNSTTPKHIQPIDIMNIVDCLRYLKSALRKLNPKATYSLLSKHIRTSLEIFGDFQPGDSVETISQSFDYLIKGLIRIIKAKSERDKHHYKVALINGLVQIRSKSEHKLWAMINKTSLMNKRNVGFCRQGIIVHEELDRQYKHDITLTILIRNFNIIKSEIEDGIMALHDTLISLAREQNTNMKEFLPKSNELCKYINEYCEQLKLADRSHEYDAENNEDLSDILMKLINIKQTINLREEQTFSTLSEDQQATINTLGEFSHNSSPYNMILLMNYTINGLIDVICKKNKHSRTEELYRLIRILETREREYQGYRDGRMSIQKLINLLRNADIGPMEIKDANLDVTLIIQPTTDAAVISNSKISTKVDVTLTFQPTTKVDVTLTFQPTTDAAVTSNSKISTDAAVTSNSKISTKVDVTLTFQPTIAEFAETDICTNPDYA